MLSLTEAKVNLFAFKVLSILHALPIICNEQTGRIKLIQSKWRKFLFLLNLTLLFLYEIHLVFSLLKLVSSDKGGELGQFSVHLVFTVGVALDLWRFAALVFFWPEANVIVFNELYRSMGEHDDTSQKRCHRRRKTEYSLHEHAVSSLPWMPLQLAACSAVIAISDPQRSHLLYNIAGHSEKSLFLFWFCLILEVYIINVSFTAAEFNQFVQISMTEKIAETETSFLRNVDITTTGRLQKSYKLCRHIKLLAAIYNEAYSYIAFAVKMVCLTLSILTLYVAITSFSTSITDSGANAVIALMAVAMNWTTNDMAYKVMPGTEELKRLVLFKTGAVDCFTRYIEQANSFHSKSWASSGELLLRGA